MGFKKFNSHINTNVLRGQINASNIFVNIPHPSNTWACNYILTIMIIHLSFVLII